ncbi:MAG: FAD-binding protein, partial [Planctomycetaceae bacterium]
MAQMSSRPLSNVDMQSSLGAFLKEQGMAPLENEPLRNHCTWRIGGPADFLVEPSSWEQVALLLQYAGENGIPAVVIGKGSNLLFDDRGLRGVVIKIGRKLSRLIITGAIVQAQSGISASRLARAAGLAGLCGLEHVVGIPGTLGGLVFM